MASESNATFAIIPKGNCAELIIRRGEITWRLLVSQATLDALISDCIAVAAAIEEHP